MYTYIFLVLLNFIHLVIISLNGSPPIFFVTGNPERVGIFIAPIPKPTKANIAVIITPTNFIPIIEKISRNDMYVVKQSNKQILVKKDGSEVLNTGYDEIKEILTKSKNQMKSFKLPLIPESYYVELSEATEAINEIINELERTPISIKVLNTRVDTARDLVLKVYNTSKEVVKTAKMAETAIVYGNRYRTNKEVDEGLTKAEFAFYKGNFKTSLEKAINAINIIEPGIHKRLMEEYQ